MDRREEQAREAERDGEMEAALALWKDLAASSSDEGYYRQYGRLAHELGRWQEAEDAFAVAIALDSNSVVSREAMGCLWIHRTDKDEQESFKTAERWFLKALELKRNARTLTLLGAVYAEMDNTIEAATAFEEALLFDSRYEEAMYNLAKLNETSYPEKALQLLEDAIEIDRDYFLAHEMLGRLYQKQKDLIRAEYHFQRCLEIAPMNYWANLYSANLFAVLGRNEQAEVKYQTALAIEPELKCGFDFYANFLESVGKVDEASRVRTEAVGKDA